MICAQTRVRGVSVSQVARRYDVNANQVFNWLKDPRFAARPEDGPEDGPEHGDAARFLPVEIVAAARPDATPAAAQGEIEIDLACGHRLRIIGSYDPEALARLIRGLSG
jgi:transposase